jgi:hypothetical protein
MIAHEPDSDKFGGFGDTLLEVGVPLFIHLRRGGWVGGQEIGLGDCSGVRREDGGEGTYHSFSTT